MLLFSFSVRFLRFHGQSFTVVRTPKIETTTFKTSHPNSVEKWYPHIHINIRNVTEMGNLYEKLDSYRKLGQYLLLGK